MDLISINGEMAVKIIIVNLFAIKFLRIVYYLIVAPIIIEEKEKTQYSENYSENASCQEVKTE